MLAATTAPAATIPAATTPGGGNIQELLTKLGVPEGVAHTIQVLSVGPIRMAIVVVVAFIVTRLVPRATSRLVRSLQLRAPALLTSPRATERAGTVGAVMGSIFRVVVWLIAFLTILGIAGINLGPFVATATVVGAAVGFGAQSLVKDFLSGLLILIEDQYGVGDTISAMDVTGTVEGLNLRTTRIRSVDGTVWYLANGEIRKVGNSSEGFNQAVVDIVVPPGTDLGWAQELASEEATGLASDRAWEGRVLEPPSVLGIQGMAADGITIRVVAKTAIADQAAVARALRARISERLRREGVAWVAPAGAPPSAAPPAAADPGPGPDAGPGPDPAPLGG